jgi:hypothetical protein
VELSIIWEEQENFLNIDRLKDKKIIEAPYLNIRYKNSTDSALYFEKVTCHHSDFYPMDFISQYPPIPMSGTWGWESPIDYVWAFSNIHFEERDGEFNVFIADYGWEVASLDTDITKNHYLDGINDGFCYAHITFDFQEMLLVENEPYQLSCFNYPDKKIISYKEANQLLYQKKGGGQTAFKIDTILLNNPRFLFLQPQEEFSERFNLLAFYIIGGSYNFQIIDKQSNLSMELRPAYFDEKEQEWIIKEWQLPEKINEYYLFEGKFNTNIVNLKIE